MRVLGGTNRNLKARIANAKRAGPAAVQSVAPVHKASLVPTDVATFMGIPESELTPRVRAAIDKLLTEAQGLREQLTGARRRILHLEELADRDALTPVMNRRAFVRELARMIALAERYDLPGSVVYFDVDGMKRINDGYGHAAGDAVLRRVAEVLVTKLRGSDVVGRLGGDEFGVILPQADQRSAGAKAAAVADTLAADALDWQGKPLDIAVSYGIYTFAGGEEAHEALHAADQAMYAQRHQSLLHASHA